MTAILDFLVYGLIFVINFVFIMLAMSSLIQLLEWLAEQWKKRNADRNPGPIVTS